MSKDRKVRGLVKMFYQGEDHSHPVRRVVLVLEETPETITGMELREGRTIRTYREARQNVKTYNKSEIARYGDYSRLKMSRKAAEKRDTESTLERLPFTSLFSQNV